MKSFDIKRVILLRIDRGEEVISSIVNACEQEEIKAALINGIGLLSRAKLAVFVPEKQAYDSFEVDKPMELASLMGNVSIKDGRPFVHLHVVLGDKEGSVAGHLMEGYIGGTGEIAILELKGELRRDLEKDGLTLLNI